MRPTLRLLHVSDLHLHHTHRREAIATIRAIGVAASDAGATAILVAGDVFDSTNQPDDFVKDAAAEISALPRPLIAIPGNHDIRYVEADGDALGLLASLSRGPHRWIIGEPESIELLDGRVRVWGRGMPEHTRSNDPLRGLSAASEGAAWHIAMAHGELSAAHGHRSSPILLERHAEALSSVDYLALGHRHAPEQLQLERTLVAYSGSASPVIGVGDAAVVDLSEAGVRVEHQHLAFGL